MTDVTIVAKYLEMVPLYVTLKVGSVDVSNFTNVTSIYFCTNMFVLFMGVQIGWLRLYSDMSKVGNVNLYGQQIDKHDEISE